MNNNLEINDNSKKNKVICILGMHRSGTSMLARILNICGVYLGEDGEILSEPAVDSNQKGHWENKGIHEINESILRVFGGSWDNPPKLKDNWEDDDRLNDIRIEAMNLVTKMNKRSRVWGFKEPRTCLTLAFWKKIIPGMIYVIPFRSAIEVSQSLKKRDGFSLLKGVMLWAIYWKNILNNMENERFFFTSQRGLVCDWRGELRAIVDFIEDNDVSFDKKEGIIDDFISKDLVHNKSKQEVELKSLASNPSIFVINEICGAIADVEYEISRTLRDKSVEINRLVNESEQKNQEIDIMKSSKFWKIRNRYLKLKGVNWYFFKDVFKKAVVVLRKDGPFIFANLFYNYLIHGREYFKDFEVSRNDYTKWIKINERIDIRNIKKDISGFKYKPKISIITPVYNIDSKWLDKCIESVRGQFYENWELCLHDDASIKKETIDCLKKWENIGDARIKISYGKENQHISGASNSALKLATGEFIALLDNDDELSSDALYEVVKTLNANSEADLIYSDEDRLDEIEKRTTPFFKPDWSIDLLLSMNYICHLGVYRRSIVESIGGFRLGFEGSQDYDLVLRFIEKVNSNNILHIPKILYHWRMIETSVIGNANAKEYAFIAAKKALTEYLNRNNIGGVVLDGCSKSRYRIKRDIIKNKKVSIIIPFRDQAEILKRCVESIEQKTLYSNYEIIIVDNQSKNIETASYLESLKNSNIKILQYDKPFNYSAINNYAVKYSDGEYILFLNNDTEVINPEWLDSMVEHIQRDEVGVVGARLLYPNNTIQHAGVIMGIGIAGHAFKHFPNSALGYFEMLSLIRNYSAVTGACMLTKRDVFNKMGGFNEDELTIAYNDVDLCLRMREAGYLIVYTPYAELYHHECLSRGNDEMLQYTNRKKFKRVVAERKYMAKRWMGVIDRDPFYNLNLSRKREDFSINI